MLRPRRIKFHGAYYHLMDRGLAYQSVFTNASDRDLIEVGRIGVELKGGGNILHWYNQRDLLQN